MIDLLALSYPWLKAIHVMAVLSWMAGLFYLPRLFVYHAERGTNASLEPAQSLIVMEDKLLRLIMNPAMVVTWAAGLLLVATPGIVDWSMIWPWTKAGAVLAMSGFHGWLAVERKALLHGRGRSGRIYRIANEIPTLLMVLIVLSVIVKF
ncbi:CopD family protein [Paracoccus ravus]|uniref:CopD family protein n=1 Tax=Paracoccus ravus TaxID=2447760 RepID=UPI00106DE22A|nr:CopD family protein [Paracoccus ravus]